MVDNLVYRFNELSYLEILKANAVLSKNISPKNFTIDILSNITVNPIKELLDFFVHSLSLNPIVRFGNYDNIVQDSFTLGTTDAVIVFYELINFSDNFHLTAELLSETEVQEIISKCKNEIDIILKNLASKPIVIFNKFSSYAFTSSVHSTRILHKIADELNEYLAANKSANVASLDINQLLCKVGAQAAFDKKKFAKYKSLYTIEFLKNYVFSIQNLLLRITGKLKKIIVFDCDNTLWKGVIGEDGPEGIDMSPNSDVGKNYHLVQKIAAGLSKKGILVALCSKNNHNEVEDLLAKHPDMALNHDHLVAMKVNWTNKNENLRALASELNIGLDSFVFIDDSAFEVNLIQAELPEVLTVTVPANIEEYPGMILDIAQRYFNMDPLQEDINKLKAYKEQTLRTEAINSLGDINNYLATLETKVIISKNKEDQISRIAQLTQKTNQFNLTTKRYSEAEITNYLDSNKATIFTIDVFDKFGASGITGVAILQEDKDVIILDSFLLSCRILGRKIEIAFINYIIEYCKEQDYKSVKAKYIQTSKNGQVKDFYANNQFTVINDTGTEIDYILDTEKYIDNTIEFITLSTSNKT
jgi:FkbH-like protein